MIIITVPTTLCSKDDSLCAALIALENRQVVVEDDFHGNKETVYYDIIDDCIVWNGFRARWRKGKIIKMKEDRCVHSHIKYGLKS